MSALTETLRRVTQAMASAGERWWIIGSAAAALHGAETSVADVDVLCAEDDAAALIAALGGELLATDADPVFRSALFARCAATPLPVEIMAGLTVRGAPVALATRIWLPCGSVDVPVPARAELVALLHSFGRPKDLARAALLGF